MGVLVVVVVTETVSVWDNWLIEEGIDEIKDNNLCQTLYRSTNFVALKQNCGLMNIYIL